MKYQKSIFNVITPTVMKRLWIACIQCKFNRLQNLFVKIYTNQDTILFFHRISCNSTGIMSLSKVEEQYPRFLARSLIKFSIFLKLSNFSLCKHMQLLQVLFQLLLRNLQLLHQGKSLICYEKYCWSFAIIKYWKAISTIGEGVDFMLVKFLITFLLLWSHFHLDYANPYNKKKLTKKNSFLISDNRWLLSFSSQCRFETLN